MPESVCLRDATECLEAETKPMRRMISIFLDLVVMPSGSDEELNSLRNCRSLCIRRVGKISDI